MPILKGTDKHHHKLKRTSIRNYETFADSTNNMLVTVIFITSFIQVSLEFDFYILSSADHT